MGKINLDDEKLVEAAHRLARAIERQRAAIKHLTAAVSETEYSRSALHEAGLQCWIDRLDGESNGHDKDD